MRGYLSCALCLISSLKLAFWLSEANWLNLVAVVEPVGLCDTRSSDIIYWFDYFILYFLFYFLIIAIKTSIFI